MQIMHIGAFDDEPQTVALMDEYIAQNGYENDITESRYITKFTYQMHGK